MGLYWGSIAVLLITFFFVVTFKFYALNLTVIKASTSIHENMIESVIRCPGRFFDIHPSGILVNKFSTDLGIIDNNLIYGLYEAVEGPFMIVIALVNLCEINPYFLIPTSVIAAVAIIFFLYARPVILSCKQLDLQKKSPIYHFHSESTNGSIQIQLYDQTLPRIKQFSKIINEAIQASFSF